MLLPKSAFEMVSVNQGSKACRYDLIIDKRTKRLQICGRQNSIITSPEVPQGVSGGFRSYVDV
jgi:hypothetical protein